MKSIYPAPSTSGGGCCATLARGVNEFIMLLDGGQCGLIEVGVDHCPDGGRARRRMTTER